MGKINISLVGGQPMPVYVGLEDAQYDYAILIHSAQSENEANIIKDNIKVDAELYEFPTVKYPEIMNKARGLLDKFKEDEVMVNISSGTKPWAIAFAMLSIGRDNTCIYYIDQNKTIHNLTKQSQEETNFNYSIATILKYHHHQVLNKSTYNYNPYDWKAHWIIRQIRDYNYDRKDFNALTTTMEKRWENLVKHNLKQEQYIYHTPSNTGSYLSFDRTIPEVEICIFRKNGRYLKKSICSPNVFKIVFCAGWFELEVAHMFYGWKYTREIWTNVEFATRHNQSKNEIDIIVALENRLLFIECKTSISKTTDIDKFCTAAKNYGGMGSKVFFVTDSPMTATQKEKCQDNSITPFSFEDAVPTPNIISQKNYTTFREYQEIWEKRKELLLSLVEKEMKIINKK